VSDEAHRLRERHAGGVTSTVSPALRPAPEASAAAQEAAAAARPSGVRLAVLDTLAAVQEAAALFAQVWRTEPTTPPLTAEVMRAMEHAGGYVVGAYAGNRLVGASAGFLGLDGNRPVLHSHISGVDDPGRGIGLALKLHQRAWALARGIDAITWTVDPLVRRNAWFNLAKLGATGVEYLVDFYGPMTDGVNGGETSDRLLMRWDLTASRTGPVERGDGVVVLEDNDGQPVPTARVVGGRALLVPLPADVEALRVTSPEAASAWRLAVRDALVPAFADGFLVRGITAEHCLLLAR
jgi:predicted GNAT superfamily acetyltransferase